MKKITAITAAAFLTAAATLFVPLCANAEPVYDSEQTITHDLNNDGTEDTITFKLCNNIYGYHNLLIASANGKETSAMIGYEPLYSYQYAFSEVQGVDFLTMAAYSDNDDGFIRVYSWDPASQDFVMQRNLNEDFFHDVTLHFHPDFKMVSGTTYTATGTAQFDGLSFSKLKKTYTLKDGKLVPDSNDITVIPGWTTQKENSSKFSKSKYLIAKKSIPLYSDKTCKKRNDKILEGDKVQVTKIHVEKGFTSYYVKGRGWYKVKKHRMIAPDLFYGVFYAG